MTTLYIVTRLDLEENEFETFRVAYKTWEAAVTEIIGDMNSLVDDHVSGLGADIKKVDRENFEIHKRAPDEWATGDFLTFGWTITEVTVEE